MVRNSMVIGVAELDEEAYHLFAPFCQVIIDVTDVYPVPQIGWLFDGQRLRQPNGQYPFDPRITPLAMRQRFTVPEILGMMNAANSDPMIKMIMDNNAIARYVDITDSATQAALGYLAQQGLLTVERMNEILTTIPTENELAFGGSL